MQATKAIFPGGLARSKARLARLNLELKATAVCAVYVHFVDLFRALDIDAEKRLAQLIPRLESLDTAFQDVDGTSSDAEDLDTSGLWQSIVDIVQGTETESSSSIQLFWVTPRAGTISPWSSQATAEAQLCGLSNVRRIERGVVFAVLSDEPFKSETLPSWTERLFDRMTQQINRQAPNLDDLFVEGKPGTVSTIKIRNPDGSASKEALQQANKEMGLALDPSEIDYLVNAYAQLGRDPSDVELFMFAQGQCF